MVKENNIIKHNYWPYSFYMKNMRHTFINFKSYGNQKLCIYLLEKSSRYVVLAANFRFVNLNVNDNNFRTLSD